MDSLNKDLNYLFFAESGLPKVAFSVHLANTQEKEFSLGTVVLFDNIVTNYGGAYNKITGSFIAPYHGLYFFTLNFMTVGNQASTLAIHDRLCTAYAGSGQYNVASCSIMKELKVGDVVNVKAIHPAIAKLYPVDSVHRNNHGFVGFLYKSLE